MKTCDHFIFGRSGGGNMLCMYEWLAKVVMSNATVHHVGPLPVPSELIAEELTYFTSWTKFCMKCGKEIDYGPVNKILSEAGGKKHWQDLGLVPGLIE